MNVAKLVADTRSGPDDLINIPVGMAVDPVVDSTAFNIVPKGMGLIVVSTQVANIACKNQNIATGLQGILLQIA